MKLQWVLAGLGIAMVAVSAYASGGDLPAAVEVKASVAPREAAPTVVAAPRLLEGFSPGNRLIAQALYSAQKAAAANGRQPWSLERVAASRASGGNWGVVFRQMKDEGLLEAETLGQVVTWYQYHQVVPVQANQVVPVQANQVVPVQANQNVPASLAGMTAPQPLPAR